MTVNMYLYTLFKGNESHELPVHAVMQMPVTAFFQLETFKQGAVIKENQASASKFFSIIIEMQRSSIPARAILAKRSLFLIATIQETLLLLQNLNKN